MAFTVDQSYVQQFSANVHMLLEREGSFLRNFVNVESIVGEKAFFERLGSLEVSEVTSIGSLTDYADAEHSRRMLIPTQYSKAVLTDILVDQRVLIDPKNKYARRLAAAMGRQLDADIIAALIGSAAEGKDGSSTVALPSSQKIVDGGVGLTIEKLITAKKKFVGNNYRGKLYCVINEEALEDLLLENEIQSADYNSIKALVAGDINTFMGMQFIIHTDSQLAGKAIVFGEDALNLGIGKDMMIRMDELPDRNYAHQIWCFMSFGAVRMEEELVVEISFV